MMKYLFCLLLLGIIPASLAYADHDMHSFDGLTVVFMDLETKGDSTLIIFPNGNTILIDGGMPSAYPNVKETLQSFGVDTIDVMIATHPDQDHIAGLNSILQDDSFDVKKILIGPTSKDTKTYQKFLELAEGASIAYAGDVIELDNLVNVTVLSPPESLIAKGSNASLENSNSVVTLLEYGNFEFLFTGDTTYTTERWLMQNYDEMLDVDIINAPHHGSKHASTEEFIDSTFPGLVIFSANTDNKYGHPHDEAVMRYTANGIPFVQTDTGNIIIQTDGIKCSVMTDDFPEMELPCIEGVQTVPEFGSVIVVIFTSLIFSVAIFRYRLSLFYNR